MQAVLEHEGGRLPVDEYGDRPALEGEFFVAAELEHGGKVELAGKPRLDLVNAAALDLDRVLRVQHTQVVIDGLVNQRLPRGALATDEHRREQGSGQAGHHDGRPTT